MTADPLAVTPMRNQVLTHCDWCHQRLVNSRASVECQTCSSAVYCQAKCRRNANQNHHRFECLLNVTALNDKDTTKHEADLELMLQTVRAVTQKDKEYFKQSMFHNLRSHEDFGHVYGSALNMATHTSKINLLAHLACALFMLECLEVGGFLKRASEEERHLYANLLMHLHMVMKTNNHSFQGEILNSNDELHAR